MACYCKNCGNKLEYGIKFCPKCGAPYGFVTMQENKIRQKKSSKKVVLIVAIAVFSVFAALAFGGIIGLLAYYSSKDGNIARSEAVGSLVTPRDMISPEQEIQAKKDFLESFYKGMEKSNDVDSYVLKFITSNAKRILKNIFFKGNFINTNGEQMPFVVSQ